MRDAVIDNAQNPRVQCHVCGKWLRQYIKGEDGQVNVSTMFGGDSDCGCICVYCIKEKWPNITGEDPAICPKCNLSTPTTPRLPESLEKEFRERWWNEPVDDGAPLEGTNAWILDFAARCYQAGKRDGAREEREKIYTYLTTGVGYTIEGKDYVPLDLLLERYEAAIADNSALTHIETEET